MRNHQDRAGVRLQGSRQRVFRILIQVIVGSSITNTLLGCSMRSASLTLLCSPPDSICNGLSISSRVSAVRAITCRSGRWDSAGYLFSKNCSGVCFGIFQFSSCSK